MYDVVRDPCHANLDGAGVSIDAGGLEIDEDKIPDAEGEHHDESPAAVLCDTAVCLIELWGW
jgi:hypothetical protein